MEYQSLELEPSLKLTLKETRNVWYAKRQLKIIINTWYLIEYQNFLFLSTENEERLKNKLTTSQYLLC